MKTLIFLITGIAMISCSRDIIDHPPAQGDGFELLWETKIADDGQCSSQPPILSGSSVYFSAGGSTYEGAEDAILAIDTATGDVIGVWNDFYHSPFSVDYYNSTASDQYLAITLGAAVCVINTALNLTAWKEAVPLGSATLNSFDGELFKGHSSNSNGIHYAELRATPLSTNSWRTVFTYSDSINWKHEIVAYSKAQLPNGNTLILVKNRRNGSSFGEVRLDVIAYNLTTDTLAWVAEDLEPGWGGTFNNMAIMDSLVIVPIYESIVCLNMNNGEVLWRYNTPSNTDIPCNIASNSVHTFEDKIIIPFDCGMLVSLNPKTGLPRWVNGDAQAPMLITLPSLGNGYIAYAGTEGIVFYRVNDGTAVARTARSHAGIISGIHVDWERRVMYHGYRNKAYCTRLPDHIR